MTRNISGAFKYVKAIINIIQSGASHILPRYFASCHFVKETHVAHSFICFENCKNMQITSNDTLINIYSHNLYSKVNLLSYIIVRYEITGSGCYSNSTLAEVLGSILGLDVNSFVLFQSLLAFSLQICQLVPQKQKRR